MFDPEFETFRIRVEQDYDAPNPREEYYSMVGFANVRGGRVGYSEIPAVHYRPVDFADAARHLTPEDVERWARIFHNLYVEYDWEYGGYWFVDLQEFKSNWPDLQPGTPEHLAQQEKVIAHERGEYRRWAFGEVYRLTLERPETRYRLKTTNPETPLKDGVDWDSKSVEWEEVESIGGVYLDDDAYAVERVALDYFDLTDDETKQLESRISSYNRFADYITHKEGSE